MPNQNVANLEKETEEKYCKKDKKKRKKMKVSGAGVKRILKKIIDNRWQITNDR